jgi:hypothetical protein
MNHTELYFIVVTLSIGIGSGAGLSQKYGHLGFFLGLFGSVIITFSILIVCRNFSPRPKKSHKKDDNDD